MKSTKFRVTAILLAAILAAAPQVNAAASNTGKSTTAKSTAQKDTAPVWSVNLGSNVTATLEHADVWQQDGTHAAVFTLNYKNGGKSPARLVSFFPKLMSGGSVNAANPITKDLAKKRIEPGQSLRVTYYAKVDSGSMAGMKLVMDVWNPQVKGYLERVGSYRLPANYSAAAAPGISTKLNMGSTPVTVQMESLEIIKYDGKVMARVGMYMTNHGGKAWNDQGLEPYLVTASGSTFLLHREAETEGVLIQPKEKKLVYYITEVPSYLKTAGLRFSWTEHDETLKLSLPVASFKLPPATAPQWDVAAGAMKKLSIQGVPVNAQIRQSSLRASGDQGIWTIEMAFKNQGKKSVTVPTYEFAIKASEGSLHPYTSDNKAGISLRAGEEKTMLMEISLPLELKQDKLKLQMIGTAGAAGSSKQPSNSTETGKESASGSKESLTLPIAYFEIPYQTERKASIGVEYGAQSAKGFAYTLESMQRLPWQDQDLILAKLRLRNTQESKSLPLPELQVNVLADERTGLTGSEIIAEEQGSLIGPGSSTEVYVMARIPYTKDIRSLRFELFTQQDTAKTPFLTMTTSGMTQSIGLLEKGKPYTVTKIGKRAEAQERRTVIYEGVDSDIVYSDFVLTSNEQRRVQAAVLKGYFQSTDGKIYEAETIQPEASLQPGSKQSVVFWARVPKGAASELGLALGTAMNGSKLAETDKDATGVMDVKKMMLNPIRPAVISGLTQLDWYPYNVSVTKAVGRLQEGSSSIPLNITIDVKRSDSITAADSGHKLILIIKDTLGQTQERTLTPGTDIQVPGTRSISIELNDEEYKKLQGGWFQLTLVDEFQNERITLGSQTYNLMFQQAVDPFEER